MKIIKGHNKFLFYFILFQINVHPRGWVGDYFTDPLTNSAFQKANESLSYVYQYKSLLERNQLFDFQHSALHRVSAY